MMAVLLLLETTKTTTTLYQELYFLLAVDGGLVKLCLFLDHGGVHDSPALDNSHLMAEIDGDRCILLNFIPEI